MPAAAGVFLTAPVLLARGVPMTDLALHEGMVSLLIHHGDPSFTRGLYVPNWGHANQLFYVLALPLAFVAGSDVACRLVVVASLLGVFVGMARLCEHLETSRSVALLAAPAVMGWTFFEGFAPNLLGMAMFILALPALDRFAAAPTSRRALVLSGLMVLLHAAHEMTAACACGAIAILSVGRRLRHETGAWMLRAVPIATAVVLAALEMRRERAVLTAFGRGWLSAGVQTHPVGGKLAHLGDLLMGPLGPVPEVMMALLVVGALLSFARGPRVDARRPAPPEPSALVRQRFALLASAFFVAYLVAPYSVNFGAFLYVRFLVPAYLVALVAVTRERNGTPLGAALCALTPFAWALVILPEFARVSDERRAVEALLPRIEEGSAVAVLEYGSASDGVPLSDPAAEGNRVLATRGGRSLHSFTEYPIAPLLIRKRARWDEPVLRVYRSPPALTPTWDLARFRYLLLRIPDAGRAAAVAEALAPDARPLAGEGAWYLFESSHVTVPIDAPDAPLPTPAPMTLKERVNAVIALPR